MGGLVYFLAGSGLLFGGVWFTYGWPGLLFRQGLVYFLAGSGLLSGGLVYFLAGSGLLFGRVWFTYGWPGLLVGRVWSTFWQGLVYL